MPSRPSASRLIALLVLAAVPVAAQDLPWDGTYRLGDDGDCARPGEAGGSLRIGDGHLEGVGARCAMTRPVDVLDMDATLYTMECEATGQRDDGGGPGSDPPGAEEWIARAMLMKAAEDDALILVWDGYAFRYDRCPDPAMSVAGRVDDGPGEPD